MVDYFGAELYKATHRKYPYVFTGVILALAAVMMLVMWQDQRGADPGLHQITASTMVGLLSKLLMMGLYLLIVACDTVFSEQYKHNTLKNEVSYGLPRARIYFGKLFTSMVTAVVVCAVLVLGYVGFSALLFSLGEDWTTQLRTVGMSLLAALPLWMGGLGFCHMLQFLMKGSTASAVTYVMVVMFMGSNFMELLCVLAPGLTDAVELLRRCALQTPFNQLSYTPPEELMGYAWTLGLSWLAASTVIGFLGFRKKEIN